MEAKWLRLKSWELSCLIGVVWRLKREKKNEINGGREGVDEVLESKKEEFWLWFCWMDCDIGRVYCSLLIYLFLI